MIKEYTSSITIKFSLNYHEAESKEDYIEKIKSQFREQYGLNLMDDEITQIEEAQLE